MFTTLLSLILLTSAVFVVSSKNPVHSLLALISTFLCSSVLLINVGAEFLALTFIIIYVGAIAVLLLFIVMMLDIKVRDEKINTFFYGPVGYLAIFILFLEILLPFLNTVYGLPFLLLENVCVDISYVNWFNWIEPLTNTQLIGQLLYTHFYVYLLVAGLILFVGILGALMLTLNFGNRNVLKQNSIRQVSRQRSNAFLTIKNQ